MQVGIRKGDTRVRSPQEPLTIDGQESATKVNSSDPVNNHLIPMAARHKITFHLSLLNAAGGNKFARQIHPTNNIPRWMNRFQRVLHKAVQNWSVRSSDKDGQSFEIRFWLPSAASVNGVRRWTGLRSFSTCLVSVDFKLVTSPAIKDGAYDQETIEISTNKVI